MKKMIAGAALLFCTLNQLAAQNTFPSTGSVGIGTATPQALLHVKGKSIIETDDDDALTFNNSDNAWQYIQFNRSNVRQAWIGLNDLNDFYFTKSTAGNFILYPTNGNVGIGNANPSEKLSVSGNVLVTGTDPYLQLQDRLTLQVTNTGANGWTRSLVGHNVKWNSTGSTWDVGAGPYSDFSMMRFENNGAIGFYTRAVTGSSYQMSDADIANYKRMYIDADGNVGIGTTLPQARLAVNGDIFSKKIRVTQIGWPDYVFHKAYVLPSLKEVEQYIKQYNHLPGLPAAAEVEKEGLDLGDNQALLLKKIEELTLYLIEQDKTLKKQQAEIEELKKQRKKK